MASLIEGFFQVVNGHPSIDDSAGSTVSPSRKGRSYTLTVYDSCVTLGSLPTGAFAECQLRLYAPTQDLDGQVIHAHGRFAIDITPEGLPSFQIDVYRFAIISSMDPASKDPVDDLRTSVTLFGHVVPLIGSLPEHTLDRYFMLGICDYVRDHTQSYTIRCRFNRTSSKRWENTSVPSLGATILISGHLEGDTPAALVVEVETMQFTSVRGSEGFGSPQASGRTKFGVPMKGRGQSSTPTSPPSSSSAATQNKQIIKPLSMLQVPELPGMGNAEPGPSASGVGKRTRTVGKRQNKATNKVSEGPLDDPVTTEEGDGSPVPKKQKTRSGNA